MADWINMWDAGNIPWHNDKVASSIVKYIEELTGGDKQARVLMPLCGKSLDMKWLADQGYTVIGVELAETAAKQFYEENNFKCTQQRLNDDVIIYEGVDVNVRIVVGDFLSCTSEMCGGKVDAVWDINSLVAMPMDNWNRYVDTCVSLMKPNKRILLSTLVYNEAERGPEPRMPYSVPTEKIKKFYGDKFDVQHLEDIDFLYFIKEEAMKEGWTPSKLDQSVHLLTLKN